MTRNWPSAVAANSIWAVADSMIIRAMTSHYRRHPLQLAALALMIVVATMLWTGVSVLTGQARDSLAFSEASVAERQSVVRNDGQPVSVFDFVTLRRAGHCVAPWLETTTGDPARRVIGIDPLAMACFQSPPGGGEGGRLDGDPFIDISEVAGGDGQLSLLASEDTRNLPSGYSFDSFQLGPATGELADSFLLNLDALSVLVLFITGLLVRSVYHLGLAQRQASIDLLERFGVQRRQRDRLLAAELIVLTLICVVPGVWLGQGLANGLGQGFGSAMNSLFDVSLYAGATGVIAWQPAAVMVALVLGVCLIDRWVPVRRHWLSSGFWVATLLFGLAGVMLAPSLLWVFVATALVFVGVGGLSPGLLAYAADCAAKRAPGSYDSLFLWRYRELAVMFRRLALPVVALQFAVATVLAVQALVTTFEDTFEEWLGQRLAADFYVEVPEGADAEAGSEALAAMDGLGDWHWVRRSKVELLEQPGQPAQRADLLALSPMTDLVTDWTLQAAVDEPWTALAAGGVMVNEQLARRQSIRLGQTLRYRVHGQTRSGPVVGVYADYGRPSGELLIHGQFFPQGADAPMPGFQSFSVNAGQHTAQTISDRLRQAWQVNDLTVRDNASLKALANQVFQQTFLLTRGISALTLALASLSLLVMGWVFFGTRARYFQLLGVWGVSADLVRSEIRRLSLRLVLGVMAVALPLGVWLTWVLVNRINPLAFGWSLPMAVYPGFWIELGVLMALIGLAIAGLIGRQFGRDDVQGSRVRLADGGGR